MLHSNKSYKFYINDADPEDFVIDFAYDGGCVLVPLIDFNTMLNSSASSDIAFQFIDGLAYYTERETLAGFQGGKAKIGCGRKAQAMMLANVVSGMKQEDVLKLQYPYNKQGQTKRYGRSALITAITVNSVDDLVRIQSLLKDFPDVFRNAGVSEDKVKSWAEKKFEKQSKRKPDRRTHPDEEK